MTPESIAKALGGHRVGSTWVARCPAHDDFEPSLSIRAADSGKTLIHCHAGCGQSDVIEALRNQNLWPGGRSRRSPDMPQGNSARTRGKGGDGQLTRAALAIWRTSEPAVETLVEGYLRARGLTIAPPATLRFHAALRHRSGGTWPAMVALVTNGSNGRPVAVHRTFLTWDGSSKASVRPQKMMLGPCRGGAVRLADAGDGLMVGEGIETCLSAMQATGRPAWAALSTGGLRALGLPDDVTDVIVLADGDEPGEAAARNCALRWKREGRRARVAHAPRGCDFNDLLMGRPSGFGSTGT